MMYPKMLAAAVMATGLLAGGTAVAPAQISLNIGGGAPVCPYGYFNYAPYNCSPYGYYGPDWFNGGLFIGAGPWFHGGHGFYGHVDNRYDPRGGYNGPLPGRGVQAFNHFQGNAAINERGQIGNAGHEGGQEHNPESRGGFGGHAGGGGGGAQRGGGGGGGHR